MNAVRTLLAALACLAGAAQAASLSVTVTDKDGTPVPDTAVMLRYPAPPLNRPVPPPVVVVDQEKMRFNPYLSIVAPGTTILFTNRDAFDHHVVATAPQVGTAPAKSFETRLPPDPTKPFGVKLTDLGRHALSCHLHSRMRGYIYVTDTPWFGKTDANGKLTLDDLPAGLVDVQLWHPEQFLDQAPLRAQLGSAPVALSGQLNFNPRVRRAL